MGGGGGGGHLGLAHTRKARGWGSEGHKKGSGSRGRGGGGTFRAGVYKKGSLGVLKKAQEMGGGGGG